MSPEDLEKLFNSSSATEDARQMNERLRRSFDNEKERRRQRLQSLESIQNDLIKGKFGGLPRSEEASFALMQMLARLSWTVSADELARAMPHFCETLSIVELREILSHLGYSSTSRTMTIANARPSQLPALIVHGSSISVLDKDDADKLIVLNPETGKQRKLNRRSKCQIVSFEPVVAEQTRRPSVSWLRDNFDRFVPELAQMLGLTFFINLTVLLTSFAVMNIYDKVIPAGAFDTLTAIGIALTIALGFELVFRHLKSQLIGRVTGRLEFLVATSIFSKLLTLPFSMIAHTAVGDQISRLRQFEAVRNLFSGPFTAVVLEIPFIILFIAGIFVVAGPLGYIPLILIATYAVIGALLVGAIRRQSEIAAQKQRAHDQISLETVSNLRQIHSLGCEDVWLDRLRQRTADASNARRRAGNYQKFLSTLSAAAIPLAGGTTVIAGALLVMDQQLTVGMLIGAMIVIWRVLAPIQQLFLMFSRYTEIDQTFKQIDQLMRLPSVQSAPSSPIARKFKGLIQFDRVVFRYQGASVPSILGVNLTIKPGEMIGVEGHSGAGKTTLLRVILDLYQPQSGAVLIDGTNVRQIPDTQLRAAVGYVPQKPVLFHGTIAQNLRLAAPAATDKQLAEICHEVGILDAIALLPKGLDTLLDHHTQSTLPSGFNQAIAIAQAYARNPRVLLLDEPAKTLDHALERALIKSLNERRKYSTIIMVSHRPSHLRMADKVLKLDRGQVVSFDPPEAAREAG